MCEIHPELRKRLCASRTHYSTRFHPNRHIKDPMFAVLGLQVLLALVQQVFDIVLADVRGTSQEPPQQVPVNDRLVPSHMLPNTPGFRVFLDCAGLALSLVSPPSQAALPKR